MIGARISRSLLARFTVLAISAIAWVTPAHALVRGKPVPAIAMYGEPKYPADFTHFDYVNPDAPKGGTFVRQNEAALTFDTFNPFTLKGAAALELGLMHDPLMVASQDEPESLYGLIAATIEIAPDNSWAEFVLRPEAKFNDGSPITAEDVAFSYTILITKGAPQFRLQFADVADVKATGPHTVRFTFKTKENRELPLILAGLPVLSKAYWEKRDFAATTLDIPVTSGAYTIETFDAGRYLTYKRNPEYWAKDLPVMRGQNNFDRVRVEYFRDDTVAFEAFKTNVYDFRRVFSAGQWARRYDFPAVLDGRVKKLEVKSFLPQTVQPILLNLRRPLFQDRRVREALNDCFDFESLNKSLFFNLYARLRSFWQGSQLEAKGPPTPAEVALLEPFRDSLPPELFTDEFRQPTTAGDGDDRANLLHARDLLIQAGWSVRDGVLTNAQGTPFTFEILLDQDGMEKVLMPWVHNLQRLGIVATIRLVDTSQYINRVNAFDFDATVLVQPSSLTPGNELLYTWGSQAADQPGSSNYGGVKSPVVDALIQRIVTATDYDALTTAIHALDRVLTWNYYAILAYSSPVERYAYWEKLKMPAVMPAMGLGSTGDSAIALWWMDPAFADLPNTPKSVPHGPSKAGAIVWVLALLGIGAGFWHLRRSMRG